MLSILILLDFTILRIYFEILKKDGFPVESHSTHEAQHYATRAKHHSGRYSDGGAR
jgi:hypothetical protein